MGLQSSITKNQNDSKLIPHTDFVWGKYYDCAEIYFANKEFNLNIQDIGHLSIIREDFHKCLQNRCWVFLDCYGYASAPGSKEFNKNLSLKRCISVYNFFGDYLKGYKRYISGGKHFGNQFARPEKQFHSEDRKVILRVKLVDARDPATGYERWYFTRVKIFMNFSPVYREWRNRGLFYLVEDYEKLYENGKQNELTIRPGDIEKVFEILQILMSSEELNYYDREITNSNKAYVITELYHRVFNREYNIAYNLFSRIQDTNLMAKILENTY